MTPGRPDFEDYVKQLDLSTGADPIEILAVGGGARATDAFEVFPKLVRQSDGTLKCRFFYTAGAIYLPMLKGALRGLSQEQV